MNTAKLLLDTIQNGGGTYRADAVDTYQRPLWTGASHIDGYYVARPRGIENLPTYGLGIEFINRFFEAQIRDTGLYLGLWKDEHGLWSVDVTEWYPDLNSAIAAGMRNNQRAIWNVSSGTEFLLPL